MRTDYMVVELRNGDHGREKLNAFDANLDSIKLIIRTDFYHKLLEFQCIALNREGNDND